MGGSSTITVQKAGRTAASLECTARWVFLPPETLLETAAALRPGPTAAAISGSLGDMANDINLSDNGGISTTYGNSILRLTNGRGWAEAARSVAMEASPACMARWERLLPETSPEAAMALRAGPTAAAISGSLAAMATMPTAIVGYLNDLWEFNPSTNEWTWMGGSSTVGSNGGQSGVYGTLGTPAAGNIPGGREQAIELDRQQRQFLALWRRGLRCQRQFWRSQRPLGV